MKSLSCLLALALAAASAQAGSMDSANRLPGQPGRHGADRTSQEVLVVRDFQPWSGDIVPRFTSRGVNVTEITAQQLRSADLSPYCLVFITGGTTVAFDSTSMDLNSMAARGNVAGYVESGGALFYNTGSWGAGLLLPGGVSTSFDEDGVNLFPGLNPLAGGISSFPQIFGSEASHDLLLGLPATAQIYLTDSENRPTAADYPFGLGRVLAMTQPFEFYLGDGSGSNDDMVRLLENAITYSLSAGQCDGQTYLGRLGLELEAVESFLCSELEYLPEQGAVALTVTNTGGSPCEGVIASLLPDEGLQVQGEAELVLGDLVPGASADAVFHLAPTGDPCGGFLHYDFVVNCANCPAESGSGLIQVPCCGVVDAVEAPLAFALSDAHPNPFNPGTSFRFTLPETGHARLDVFDLAGKRVATLLDGPLAAGAHNVAFDGSRLASGLYLARLESAGRVAVSRALLVK